MSVGVYLAKAIDQAPEYQNYWALPSLVGWLTSQPKVGWVYDPKSAFAVGAKASRNPGLRAINTEALDRSGVLVAVLPAGVASIGVPMEIERAVSTGKPVVVISDAPSWSLEYGDSASAPFHVAPSWGLHAQKYIRESLLWASENPVAPGRVPMPTVVDEGAEEPRRGYDDDAGLDLIVNEAVVVHPGQFADISCGVSVELPEWSFGMLTGRSSTLRKRGLLVNQGIIDAGYRGPLFAGVWNLTDQPVKVEAGERVAQLILLENGTRRVQVQQVKSLAEGSRGSNGFGSTGA